MPALTLDTITPEQFEALLRDHEENNNLKAQIFELKKTLAWFQRQIFGGKSERFIPNADQMSLELDDDASDSGERSITTQTITYDRTTVKRTPRRHPHHQMPTHLPIIDEIIDPVEDVSGCTHIGDDVSWEFDYQEATMKVRRFTVRKYARPDGEGIISGSRPSRPIERSIAGPGLLSKLVIDKYYYHLPVHRQHKQIKNLFNVSISETTLYDLVRQSCEKVIEPLYVCALKQLKRSGYVQADDTLIPVMIKSKKGKTHRGYLWVYYDPLDKVAIFEYRDSREQRCPDEFLVDFSGIIQTDGYAGYNRVLGRSDITGVACMAHVRREFEEALGYNEQKASYALRIIRRWFLMERLAKKRSYSHEQRRAMRQEYFVHRFGAFRKWMERQVVEETPQSPIRKACAYALNLWNRFDPYLQDGRVELSNNLVENVIRPVVLGRKNWMFAGSPDGARRTAMFYSLMAMAKMHNVNVHEWLNDVMTRVQDYPANRLADLLPQNWQKMTKNTEA